MTGKELLKLCRQEQKEIWILSEKREALASSLLPKAMAIKAVSVMESAEPDPVAKRMAAVIDLDRTIERQIKKLMERRQRGYEIIAGIDKPDQRKVLVAYYMADEPVKLYDVAEQLHFSYDRTRHIMGEALNYLERITV